MDTNIFNNSESEKILFYRDKSNNTETTSTGVLVIDPNSVVDTNNNIKDRYIKQEDLTIYVNLKALKKTEYSVINNNGNYSTTPPTAPIFINFLNPLKSMDSSGFKFKNKFTTDWSEYFTNDSTNNKNSSDYIMDPETFGISDIDIGFNAQHIPVVNITFIDIQGKTLFERGNDPENPYNIFFSYPYPKFLLTYKGFYGKSVEYPLVLFKADTKFDPSSGNYIVSAQFYGDVFSLMSTLLIIYPYVVPFMFPTDDGSYLGQKILNQLYDEQNKKITQTYGNDPNKLAKYQINNLYPTMWDLANAIKKIQQPAKGIIGQQDNSANNNDKLLSIRVNIDQFDMGITNYFKDFKKYNTNSTLTSSNSDNVNHITYTPTTNDYLLTSTTPIDLIQYISSLNNNIAEIVTLNTSTNNYSKLIETALKGNASIKSLFNNFDINNIITTQLFYFDNKNNVYTLDNYNIVINIIYDKLSDIQMSIESQTVINKIATLSESLGYEPNMFNVLRIISNNVQAFLILLEIIGQNSVKQIQNDPRRQGSQKAKTTYKVKNNQEYYSPFPSYYTTGTNLVKGDTKYNLDYPGVDDVNSNWFEVAFIEEIYKAVERLKTIANPTKTNISAFGTKPTGISTIFALGQSDLTAYEGKTQSTQILGEMLIKYTLHSSYSGFLYRGLTAGDLGLYYSNNVSIFETALLNELILGNTNTPNSQFLLGSTLKNATKLNGTKTYLASLANSLLGFKGGSTTYKNIINSSIQEIKLYKQNNYTETSFNNIVSLRNNIVNSNIGNKPLYIQLYNTSLIPTNYSMQTPNKQTTLSVYSNLNANSTFYCDIDTTQSLQNINTGLQNNISNNNINTNSFQGFIGNLNQKLSKTTLDTNFTNNVSFGITSTPALTYNNLLTDNTDVFVNVPKPVQNVTNKFKTIIKT